MNPHNPRWGLSRSSERCKLARQPDQMKALPKSRVLRFVEQAMRLARRVVARYCSKFSKPQYTFHQRTAGVGHTIRKIRLC
jgi:hypothetical protein